jgi:hypothetical protein
MTLNHRRIWAIIAISTWPALNYLEANWAEVVRRGPRSVFWVVVYTLLFAACGLVAYRIASKRRPGGGGLVVGVCLAMTVLVFSYSSLDSLREWLFTPHLPWFTTPMAWAALIAAAIALMYRFRRHTKLHEASITFCLLVAGLALARLIVAIVQFDPPVVETADGGLPAQVPPRLPGMNVYYILVDAYAGRRALRDVAGYDNTPFYTDLEKRGFIDASTEHSNYLRTVLTLGGIFALDYPRTDDPATWESTKLTYPEIFDAAQPPPLIRRLHAAGYAAWHSATPWGGCTHRYLKCLGDQFMLESDYVTRTFLAPTPLGRPLEFLHATTEDAFASVETRLPLIEQQERQVFVFAHLMDAHPPFQYDTNCGKKWTQGDDWNGWHKGLEHEYVDAIKCVNKRVEHLVDFILARQPNSIIVLQGDHGSAFRVEWNKPMAKWSQESIAERASYLNLVLAPKDCRQWLAHPLGQINTARFVAACIEGRAPEYIAERTYMTTYSTGAEMNVVRLAPPF